MVRAVSALTGAVVGSAIGSLFRPEIFGEPVPFRIVFSKEPTDAPFREMMIQNVSFSILAGAAVAMVVIPLALRMLTREPAESGLTAVRISERPSDSRRQERPAGQLQKVAAASAGPTKNAA